MSKKMINIMGSDGNNISCICVNSTKKNVPAIIIISENLVINNWINETTDKFAEQGYVVIAPDIFRHVGSGFIMNPANKVHTEKNLNLKQTTNYEAAIVDLASTITAAKALPNCNGKIGVVGFSYGATLAYLSAARLHVDAVVAYYGTEISKYLNEGKNITCPLLLHMSENDNTLETYDLNKIQAALIGKENVSIYTYTAGHGFANSYDPTFYLSDAASLAHKRTFKIFDTLK